MIDRELAQRGCVTLSPDYPLLASRVGMTPELEGELSVEDSELALLAEEVSSEMHSDLVYRCAAAAQQRGGAGGER